MTGFADTTPRVGDLRLSLGGRRRQLHKRLALLVSDPEERARHLALCTTEPDEESPQSSRQPLRWLQTRRTGGSGRALFGSKAVDSLAREEELTSRGLGEAKALLAAGDIDGARKIASEAGAASAAGLRAERNSSSVTSTGSAARGRRDRAPGERTCGGARRSGARGARPKLVNYTAHAPTTEIERAERALAALSSERVPAAVASVAFDLYWAELLLGHGARQSSSSGGQSSRTRPGRMRRRASSLSSTSTRSTTSTPRAIGTPSKPSGTACVVRRGGWPSASRISASSSSAPDSGTWPSGSSRIRAPQSLSSSARPVDDRLPPPLVRRRGTRQDQTCAYDALPLIDEANRSGGRSGSRSSSRRSPSWNLPMTTTPLWMRR